MQDSLLWVYEGQTQFWGYVLAARSGLLKKEDALGYFATVAATYDHTPGRSWRPLIDTTNDPIIADRPPLPWRSWQRSEDYYSEGLLIWADVDRIIRQQSRGRRSLDDFARAFFGMNDGDWNELTYTYDDVVATLNAVQPYDWSGYFDRKVNDVAEKAPLEGFTEGGYRLVYTDQPTSWWKAAEKVRENIDLSYSGGFILSKEGRATGVLWDGAAFNAGLTVGSELLAVNGRSFNPDRLKTAIKDAKTGREPIRLLVKSGDAFRSLDLDWHGGLRYPRFEKSGRGDGTLDALLAPKP
jgi:predicted metalloprotease with PDZ domain